MLVIAQYKYHEYNDGSFVPACLTEATTFWPKLFFTLAIAVFFVLPLGVLLALYGNIARHLMAAADRGAALSSEQGNCRGRRQVVLMLGTVVLLFFLCLLPFRALTLWIVFVSDETVLNLGVEKYFNILYFCRTMHYLNSAINPILYNLMSSKFRAGFARICGLRRRQMAFLRGDGGGSFLRNGTFHTTSSLLSQSSTRRLHAQHRSAPDLFAWRSSSRTTPNNNNSSPTSSRKSVGSVRRNAMMRSTMLSLELESRCAVTPEIPESSV